MNLDDLMAVWRSQDAAPLHSVNETLLRLALRQDETKLQAQRRLESRIIYVMSAGAIAGMAIFLVMIFGMFYYNDDDVITAWDFAIPIVGATAALLMSVAHYLTHAYDPPPLAEKGLAAAKARVGQIDLTVDVAGAEISVDGQPRGVTPLAGPLYVEPGKRTIEAKKGSQETSTQVEVAAGRQTSASLSLGSSGAAPTPAAGRRPHHARE